MIGSKVKRLRIQIGRRLAIPDGNLYVDAYSGFTVRQRLGIWFLGGKNFMNQESTISFDPEGAQRFPHIAAVEGFLGGVARLVFEDGTVQFAENETYPDIVYSPQLPEPELEVFCGKHMAVYEQYFDENFEAMDRGDDLPPIDRFWE